MRLPESDLLKAVHAYTADFYARNTTDGGQVSIRSMNETALLAMGILLEEAMVHVLGDTGDMALVEGEPDISDQADGDERLSPASGQSRREAQKEPSRSIGSGEQHIRKRQKREERRD